jgi:Putative prokaryotic signal transducing protein
LRFDRGVELDGRADLADDGEDGAPPHEYTWKTELCECDTREQAWQLRTMLERAKIESWLFDPARDFATRVLGRTPFRVMVAADQLEEARKILAQPIPQDVIDELQMEVPAYVIPRCPACGDSDPTLLEGEESNRWSCEVCGKEWTELEKLPDEHG